MPQLRFSVSFDDEEIITLLTGLYILREICNNDPRLVGGFDKLSPITDRLIKFLSQTAPAPDVQALEKTFTSKGKATPKKKGASSGKK